MLALEDAWFAEYVPHIGSAMRRHAASRAVLVSLGCILLGEENPSGIISLLRAVFT